VGQFRPGITETNREWFFCKIVQARAKGLGLSLNGPPGPTGGMDVGGSPR